MISTSIWAYLHILLFVFWLGTDVGVFTAAIFLKNPAQSYETRLTLMRLLSKIDILPRLCFALILPVGLQLTRGLEIYPVSDALLAAGWAIGLGWSVYIYFMMQNEGKPLGRALSRIQVVFEAVMGLLFVGIGGRALIAGTPELPDWYAAKLVLFGCIFLIAILMHVLFLPFEKPFVEIGTHGSTPEREAIITRTINRALVAVLALYFCIAATAFLGTVKPF